MENFFRIRAEKQEHIVKAAFLVFGRQGYRKASVADIAKSAGITKGMVTYYFGSKKTLYLYLMDLCRERLTQAIASGADPGVRDFFERVRYVVGAQMEALGKYPAMVSFLNSAYAETDPEVAGEVAEAFAGEDAMCRGYMLEGERHTAFRPGFDPRLVCKLALWASDGFFGELYEAGSIAEGPGELAAEFYRCLDAMALAFREGGVAGLDNGAARDPAPNA